MATREIHVLILRRPGGFTVLVAWSEDRSELERLWVKIPVKRAHGNWGNFGVAGICKGDLVKSHKGFLWNRHSIVPLQHVSVAPIT